MTIKCFFFLGRSQQCPQIMMCQEESQSINKIHINIRVQLSQYSQKLKKKTNLFFPFFLFLQIEFVSLGEIQERWTRVC